MAVAAGLFIPVQGRINGALGVALGRRNRRRRRQFQHRTGADDGHFPGAAPRAGPGWPGSCRPCGNGSSRRYYVLAGCIGAFFVFAQSFTVGLLGVALFTVAAVTGQTLSGLLVDRLGIGPAGKRPITGIRVIGSMLTVAAVAWAVSPQASAAGGIPGRQLLVPVLLPVLAGFLMSFQQAMNGTATVHYGTPIAATLVNFVAGGALLWVAWLIKLAVAGAGNPLPAQWWYYLGGPMGCVFIGVGALLVRSLGVLVTGLGHDRRASCWAPSDWT